MPTRVLVLGGGVVGTAAAWDLQRLAGISLTVVDARAEAARAVADRLGVAAHVADLSAPDAVTSYAREADLVIGALPSALGYTTLRTILDIRRPYVDVSFMPEDAREHHAFALRRDTLALVDCGVAPGLSNLMLGWATTRLQPCERVSILVGGLPVERMPPFEYKAPFSPYDVLEEYVRPSRMVEDGRLVVKEALSEVETLEIPGAGLLEAFNTDGLRSLLDLGVPNMREKTLRYPGHAATMRAFREAGFFSKDPVRVGDAVVRPLDVTAAVLFPRWRFEPDEPDLTVMQVEAEGRVGGRRLRHHWQLVDRHDPRSGLSSMARTTGFVATALARRMLDGTFADLRGVLAPETLGRRPGVLDGVVAELRERGIGITHREEPQAG